MDHELSSYAGEGQNGDLSVYLLCVYRSFMQAYQAVVFLILKSRVNATSLTVLVKLK